MKTITEIFKKSNSPLAKLIGKTRSSQDLEVVFHTVIDENLAKHCKLANYEDSKLTVTVTNTSWATRLRYAIPDIIKNLQVQPEFKAITSLRYTINSPQAQAPKLKSKNLRLSHENELLWKKTIADLKKIVKARKKRAE